MFLLYIVSGLIGFLLLNTSSLVHFCCSYYGYLWFLLCIFLCLIFLSCILSGLPGFLLNTSLVYLLFTCLLVIHFSLFRCISAASMFLLHLSVPGLTFPPFPGRWMGGCKCPTRRVCPMSSTAGCGAGQSYSPITSCAPSTTASTPSTSRRRRCASTPTTTPR